MARFVVSYFCFFNNELKSEVIEADSWDEAIQKSSFELNWIFEELEELSQKPTLERVKQLAFDGDCMVEVIEV
jgi:hypothetical protein